MKTQFDEKTEALIKEKVAAGLTRDQAIEVIASQEAEDAAKSKKADKSEKADK